MLNTGNKVLLLFLLSITIISLAGILLPAKQALTGSLAIDGSAITGRPILLIPRSISSTNVSLVNVTEANATYESIRVCSSHSDCPSGFCINFRCEDVECVDDTHCSNGYICKSNTCIINRTSTETTTNITNESAGGLIPPRLPLGNLTINITNVTIINISLLNRTLPFIPENVTNITANVTNATVANISCVAPQDDLIISTNVVLCRGTYNITDVDDNGVLILNADDLSIIGNGTIINGVRHAEDQGLVILIDGLNNIRISGITMKNFYLGAYANGENIFFVNNSFVNMLAGIYYPATPEESSIVVNAATSNSFTNVEYPVVGMIEEGTGEGDQEGFGDTSGDSLGGDTGGLDGFVPPGVQDQGDQDQTGDLEDENKTQAGLDEGKQEEETEVKSKPGDLLGRATSAYDRGISKIRGLFTNISAKQYNILITGLFILIATILIGVIIGTVKYYRETGGIKLGKPEERHEEVTQAAGIQTGEEETEAKPEEEHELQEWRKEKEIEQESILEEGAEEESKTSYEEVQQKVQREAEEQHEYFDEYERQLHEYIIACKEQGIPDNVIRQKLTEVGWKKELIDKYL